MTYPKISSKLQYWCQKWDKGQQNIISVETQRKYEGKMFILELEQRGLIRSRWQHIHTEKEVDEQRRQAKKETDE